ncbi:MAG: alpha/beta hydrolase [Hyphomonadaceae bacterium]
MLRRLMTIVTIILLILAAGWLALRRADIPFQSLETVYTSQNSQFLTLSDGVKLHYRDEGLESGDTLVLVHGFAASLHTWEPWVERLKDDYRIISLDLPGHGLSRNPDGDKMNPGYFGEMIDEMTMQLQADTFVLVGNSMGGATAWQFALEYPERLEGLVLVDASGWPSENDDNRPLVFSLLDNSVARFLLKDLDMSGLVHSGLRDSFFDQALVTENMVERYVSLSRAPGHREGILAMSAQRDDRVIATEALVSQINSPTLILQGREDNLVAASGAEKFAAGIPRSELIIYDNVGHLPQEEIADRSAADLQDFLARRIWTAPLSGELPASAVSNE